jgi:1-acyl-sn-glycerol-3-phosphate acyltransferase
VKYIHLAIAVLIVALTFVFSIFVAMIPAALMRLCKKEAAAQRWMRFNGTNIARTVLWSLGVRVKVSGAHHIPAEGSSVCFVSNHQSALDIPAVLAALAIWPGFITKAELKKVPILNVWIRAMNCVYIDRNSPRSAIGAILSGVEHIRRGIPMFIFPEGTRSKTGALGAFKSGSLKLATRAKAIIVPITIDGTRKALEAKVGVRPVTVFLSVAPPVITEGLDEQGLKELPDHVYRTIEQQFRSLSDQAV